MELLWTGLRRNLTDEKKTLTRCRSLRAWESATAGCSDGQKLEGEQHPRAVAVGWCPHTQSFSSSSPHNREDGEHGPDIAINIASRGSHVCPEGRNGWYLGTRGRDWDMGKCVIFFFGHNHKINWPLLIRNLIYNVLNGVKISIHPSSWMSFSGSLYLEYSPPLPLPR